MIGVLGNQKGGVAKTTNTVHLGASLSNQGYKVLLIDFDSQCDLSHNVGVDVSENNYDIEDLMEERSLHQLKKRLIFLLCLAQLISLLSNIN